MSFGSASVGQAVTGTNIAANTTITAVSGSVGSQTITLSAGTSGAISASATIYLTTPFNATICPTGTTPDPSNSEIVRITAVSTDTLTITRAQESSTARTVVATDVIFAGPSAKTLTDVETAVGNLETLPINAQTSTTYTTVLGDAGKVITATNASAVTITIPANSSVAYPVGTQMIIVQGGAGAVTVSITTDTLLKYSPTSASTVGTAGQNAAVTLIKTGTTTWYAFGAK
jgi:hypothetical protein